MRFGPQLSRRSARAARRDARRDSVAAAPTSTRPARDDLARCGEAMAANRVTQVIDPWPAASGRNNIAYNGERAAGRGRALSAPAA